MDRNYILINPEVKETTVQAVIPLSYKDGFATKEIEIYEPVTVKLTVSDMIFHEFGHVIYDGGRQDKVLDYNNIFRKIVKMGKRPYDEKHNEKEF